MKTEEYFQGGYILLINIILTMFMLTSGDSIIYSIVAFISNIIAIIFNILILKQNKSLVNLISIILNILLIIILGIYIIKKYII